MSNAMIPKLKSAEYVRGYTVRLLFADGRQADVDFESELWGEVFEPLKDEGVFRAFRLDEELNTIVWACGADFAPEFLYEKVAAQQGTAADRTSRGR